MNTTKLNISISEENVLQKNGYKLISKLGDGTYAKVYLGEYTDATKETVKFPLACKIIDKSEAPKNFVSKFLPRELKILLKINHPHLIQIHSIFEKKPKIYIFMRYAELGDMLEFLTKNGPIHEDQARVWVRQLALGLQYLHILQIAHRDMKCENILITANYNVKISDFGFARHLSVPNDIIKLSETFCGSLPYAPPQIINGEPYNPKIADMWSFGIVIYTMVNKCYPFDHTNTKTMYTKQINKKWKFKSKYVDIISNQLKALITNLLEPDVSVRYSIEDVIKSDWFAMDPDLKILSRSELTALSSARVEAKISDTKFEIPGSTSSRSNGNSVNSQSTFPTKSEGASIQFYKKHDEDYSQIHSTRTSENSRKRKMTDEKS